MTLRDLAGLEFEDLQLAEEANNAWPTLSTLQLVTYAVLVFTLFMNIIIAELGDQIRTIKEGATPQVGD